MKVIPASLNELLKVKVKSVSRVRVFATPWTVTYQAPLSLGQEDPLEKEMAVHSSAIAWKIPWTEEPGRLQSMGSLDMSERLHSLTLTHEVGLIT